MPVPFDYQNAFLEFDRFMVDARDLAGLATTNMAWNMVVGVLHTFRSRLSVKQALLFADVLPPVIRAIFVESWNVDSPLRGFASGAELLAEVRSVRSEHNFSPSNAISAVAGALRKHVDNEALDRVLSTLPAGSREFWA
jgi:uncharacterized protein (DUF2267 family)